MRYEAAEVMWAIFLERVLNDTLKNLKFKLESFQKLLHPGVTCSELHLQRSPYWQCGVCNGLHCFGLFVFREMCQCWVWTRHNNDWGQVGWQDLSSSSLWILISVTHVPAKERSSRQILINDRGGRTLEPFRWKSRRHCRFNYPMSLMRGM